MFTRTQAGPQAPKEKVVAKKEITVKPEKKLLDISHQPEGDIIKVVPVAQTTKPARANYSVPHNVNVSFLRVFMFLKDTAGIAEAIGCTQTEYRKNIIRPLENFIKRRVRPRKRSQAGKAGFVVYRVPKDALIELRRSLDGKVPDLPEAKKDEKIAFLDAAKIVRSYFNF